MRKGQLTTKDKRLLGKIQTRLDKGLTFDQIADSLGMKRSKVTSTYYRMTIAIGNKRIRIDEAVKLSLDSTQSEAA